MKPTPARRRILLRMAEVAAKSADNAERAGKPKTAAKYRGIAESRRRRAAGK